MQQISGRLSSLHAIAQDTANCVATQLAHFARETRPKPAEPELTKSISVDSRKEEADRLALHKKIETLYEKNEGLYRQLADSKQETLDKH